MDARTKVSNAIKQLSQGANKPGNFFRVYFSAFSIAGAAKVSITTARKYAKELSRCRGFASKRFSNGSAGYTYYGED